MYASNEGFVEVCRILLVSGADVSIMERVRDISIYIPRLMIIYQYTSRIRKLSLI